MRGHAGLVALAAALAMGGCASGGAAVAEGPRLNAAVDSARTPPLDRMHWGVLVVDAASGRTLQALNPRLHFVPASNNKLVVTAVAMGVLGPDYRYRTRLYGLEREGAPAGVVRALVAVGSGDPTWSERFHGGDRAVLESLADSVRAAGIRRVEGPLIVDASRFDAVGVHPTWEIGDLVWSYATPVAAFAVAEGTVRVIVSPGAAEGDTATIRVDAPAGTIPVRNDVLTDAAGTRTDIDIERGPYDDTLRVSGLIAAGGGADTSRLAVTDAARFAGRVLEDLLEARGIEVTGGVEVIHDPVLAGALAARDSSDVLRVASWQSAPMSEIVAAILKPSQNWIAEQVLKTLGAEERDEGSWSAGLAVERRYLIDRAGIDSASFSLVDASGLSAQNLLSPEAVVKLLDHARRQPWAAEYRRALAEPGQSGTLSRRLAGLEGRVAAKTGSIANVNSLSGYLRADDGGELIFSILSNASGAPSADVRAAIDRIVRAAARGN